jgi:hypothetical protein
MPGLRVLLGETEISYDGSAVAQEDIGQFEVTMQVATLGHLYESSNDVLHDLEDFLFADSSSLLEEATEISLVTVLCDDVAMRGLTHHIIALQDVGVLDLG